MKRFSGLFSVVILAALFSCISTIKFHSGFQLKGDTIGVISGTNKKSNLQLVDLILKDLQEKGKFKVTDQARAAKILAGYPFNLKGPYIAGQSGYEKNFQNTDVDAIGQIQRRLGVKYLLVVWIPQIEERSYQTRYRNGAKLNETTGFIYLLGQMFGPDGDREVARIDQHLNWAPGDGNTVAVSATGSAPHSPEAVMKLFSRYLADSLLAETGMKK